MSETIIGSTPAMEDNNPPIVNIEGHEDREQDYGPKEAFCDGLHAQKYRGPNESFPEAMYRLSATLADDENHRQAIKDILLNQRFLPAGRVQSAVGSGRAVTAINCFVSGEIEDSMKSIMERAGEAAETMRQGGGIGYDFSTIRPRGDRIVSQGSIASGPVSFMEIFNAICGTVASAGHRRGAQMGVLRVDHPDIQEFVRAKQNKTRLTNFNVSVGVTDEFMNAVLRKEQFELKFNGRVYSRIDAASLWDEIMRATWDWSEPGVLFLDRINGQNNLWYVESIDATNPCGEQPLPPGGSCLLGSFNLTKYVSHGRFDYIKFVDDIAPVVRMMDNVIENTQYPLPIQEREEKMKRRMGLGVTGVANALEIMGLEYGSDEFIAELRTILGMLRDCAYEASCELAKEKGAFPMFETADYTDGEFIRTLPEHIRQKIAETGIRNSHLLSIAPCGTISLTADNVSSGIEPVFALEMDRVVQTEEGAVTVPLKDFGYREWGVKGKTADQLTIDEHLNVLLAAAPFVDSAISKTLNVGDEVTFNEFKSIYMKAWLGGSKGCTTFRPSGKRFGILQAKKTEQETEGAACTIDLETGIRTCDF